MGLHALLGALLLSWVARWFMQRGISDKQKSSIGGCFQAFMSEKLRLY
jgi:hypothetical protein